MDFGSKKQYIYERNQLVEVICQLRFPTILSIDAKEPADFQETVREKFPRYNVNVERVPQPGGVQEVKNYTFVSADGGYKISLTKNFLAISTVRYTSWQDFAAMMDEPIGQFISIYKPAYFERIGLRYVNGICRSKLDMEGNPWADLIDDRYLGVLADSKLDEKSVTKCSVDIERKLDERCNAKIHAGPGLIQRKVMVGGNLQTTQEKEPRFIFDQDIYSAGNIKLQDSATLLEELHTHADYIFADAISDELHEAMSPVYTA